MTKSLNSDEVKTIVKDEINKFVSNAFDKEVKKALHNANSQSREEILAIIKNAMESVYKVLWVKRDFWKNDIR